MQKLRAVIDQHGRWAPLTFYVDRVEAARDVDFSNALENAKALLECIGKEICDARDAKLEANPNFNGVLKKAFGALGYPGGQMVTQMSTSLANIGQHLGELRNQISPTSHGRPLAELEARNSQVDLLTREFLLDSTVVVAVFLIRAFEERQAKMPAEAVAGAVTDDVEEANYDNHEAFNDYWDETFGEFAMGDYTFNASEILFALDQQAYAAECQAFTESEADDSPGEGA